MDSSRQQRSIRRARKAGLHYVHDFSDGWSRRRCGGGFMYVNARGKRLTGARTLQRIAALAIPPAWEDVRICPSPNGHIQAIGRDAKGRQQYLYHESWHAISSATKFDRLEMFGSLLPRIRRRVRRDLGTKELSKERVVAAIVRLIDKAYLRVGSPAYAENNGSHGATTLRPGHVEIDDLRISLDFPGKGGKQTEVCLADAKVAAVIQQCEEISGQFLFCYRGADGDCYSVGSSDVNTYLKEVAGEAVTAKDFRTWWGSVLALRNLKAHLAEADGKPTNRALLRAIEMTAGEMGHTKAVCRQSYIHPGLLVAFEAGKLSTLLQENDREETGIPAELTRDEALLLSILPALTGR
jgi:DNA topoisomerase I